MRFAIGATAALAAAFVRAEDASSPEAEASPSSAITKPTFKVCFHTAPRSKEAFTDFFFAGHNRQGALPRAIH